MTQNGQPLRAEILKEASRQREQILQRAQATADHLMADAKEQARQTSDVQLQAALVEANRRREAILATVVVEAKRFWLNRTEELLHALHDQVQERLRTGNGFTRRQALIERAAEALARMHGDAFVLRLSTHDAEEVGLNLTEGILQRAKREVVKLDLISDPDAQDGDWVLQDVKGQQRWRLGLEARLERLWPELRCQVAAQLRLGDDV